MAELKPKIPDKVFEDVKELALHLNTSLRTAEARFYCGELNRDEAKRAYKTAMKEFVDGYTQTLVKLLVQNIITETLSELEA